VIRDFLEGPSVVSPRAFGHGADARVVLHRICLVVLPRLTVHGGDWITGKGWVQNSDRSSEVKSGFHKKQPRAGTLNSEPFLKTLKALMWDRSFEFIASCGWSHVRFRKRFQNMFGSFFLIIARRGRFCIQVQVELGRLTDVCFGAEQICKTGLATWILGFLWAS
jgi:hypothetical protein